MRKTITILMLLLLAGWLLGCSSDETAPNDPLPELTSEDVANQSGYMAVFLTEMAPVALEFSGKADASDGRYSYVFGPSDDIAGTVQLYFETAGAPSSYTGADFARAWTADDAPLELRPIPDGIAWLLAFSLESDIDQGAGTALVEGSGTLTIGNFEPVWTVEGLAVEVGGDWPAAGVMTFTNEGITATVTFDGDNTATVTVGSLTWTLNLSNGTLTEL